MEEVLKIIFGILFLFLGIPIGNFLAKMTKEELKSGRKWFRLVVIFSLIGGMTGLILRNDVLMFSLFFIAIVTSRSKL
jgi:formate hydrogenlyase subunit 3/multisubunit Na+/H+ antiporter MnhD subunit